ncbi:MAG: type II toxin-antitoxin system CcdA family antitoxin [Caldimonas sp.]|nr:type II toxin-antitoxin system CcdA family antitoxin [Caldimonas caldifontis]
MTMLRFDDAPKRPTNLSLNAKVLDAARDLGLNLSQTVDELLAAEVRRRYWERWNEENRAAIDAYNDRIAREGLPLARYRSFAKGR